MTYGEHKTFDKSRAANKVRPYEYNTAALDDESRILSFMAAKGHSVIASEALEDMTLDIDCYIGGIATSIKAQHSGAKVNPKTGQPYNNVYFELTSQHYTSHHWTPEVLAKLTRWGVPGKVRGFSTSTWGPSWYFTGEAEQYLILQGDRLRLYLKGDIERTVAAKGWQRVLGLSWKVLASQGGKNTVCGYLDAATTPWVAEWTMPGKTEAAPLAA